MKPGDGPAARFLRATMSELAGADATGPAPLPTSLHCLVGAVGRDVIILGDVPGNALELVLGRTSAPQTGSA